MFISIRTKLHPDALAKGDFYKDATSYHIPLHLVFVSPAVLFHFWGVQ